MVGTKVASKYAGALFAAAEDQRLLDTTQQELHLVRGLVRDVPDLMAVLQHPRMDADRKKGIVTRALATHVSPLTLDFLSLLIDKKRANLLEIIIQEFDRLLDEARGIQRAEVRSAVPLDDELVALLTERLTTLTGKKVVLRRVVEPGLLGGLVIHVGGQLIDGSLASHLETIRERLQHVRVTGEALSLPR